MDCNNCEVRKLAEYDKANLDDYCWRSGCPFATMPFSVAMSFHGYDCTSVDTEEDPCSSCSYEMHSAAFWGNDDCPYSK